MAEVRQRKANAPAPAAEGSSDNEAEKKQTTTTTAPPPDGYDTGPIAIFASVFAILFVTGAAIVGLLYLFDPLQHLNLAPKPPSAASTPDSTTGGSDGLQTFTDASLLAYAGADASLPLLLAINGTVVDVSAGRSFYGPGGPYAHFAGRDATRAWVTECFGPDSGIPQDDSADAQAKREEQWTHDMRGVDAMFAPKYLDEVLEDAADGVVPAEGEDVAAFFGGRALTKEVRDMAKRALERIPGDGGRVSARERERRREADRVEAREKVEAALKHWVDFFGGSGKYPVVGRVVREEGWEKDAPPPPPLCEKAKKKRPVKGGKLEALMAGMAGMRGGAGGAGGKAGAGQMPDFVREKWAKGGGQGKKEEL